MNGEAVEYDTAHNFIYWMKGYVAQHYIDWERMGIRNPLRNWYALAENDSDRDEDSPDDDYDPERVKPKTNLISEKMLIVITEKYNTRQICQE